MLHINDGDGGWSATLIGQQPLLVPPRWARSPASLAGTQGHHHSFTGQAIA